MNVNLDTGEFRPYIVRNQFNYHLHRSPILPNNLPSCTIPDQVLTIDEILRRYARDPASIPPVNPVFDSPYPNMNGMDRLDKAQLAMDIKQNISDYEEAVQTEKAAKEAADKLASIEATKHKTEGTPPPQEATPPPSPAV